MSRSTKPQRLQLTRRGLLFGGAAAGVGAIGAATAIAAEGAMRHSAAESRAFNGSSTVPFYGRHQAGIATPAQAHGSFIALDLKPDVDRARLASLMRILSDDAARLTQGEPALADMEAELALNPANLTVTFGFGPGLVARAGAIAPDWLAPLPAFGIDRLQPEWTGGDLLLQVCSDDPGTLQHASRMLMKDARSFTEVRWVQTGFRRAHDTAPAGQSMRNLFGQVDETVNPEPGTAEFDRLVWSGDGWLDGGSSLVVRRIAMNLDAWDRLDRAGREESVGRRLDTGAPLTGTLESDEPDFEAELPSGFKTIAPFAHIRRARGGATGPQFLRRAYSYAEASASSPSDAGLIFAAYQADVAMQFTPVQRRLAELDLLNSWTTPIGSAVFALPPGCQPGGFVGETLLA